MSALDRNAAHDGQAEAEGFAVITTPDDAPLDAAAQELIGVHLRALFDSVVQEPIPERFLLLLQSLEVLGTDLA